MRGGLALIAVVCVAPGTAHAGRSFFGWLQGSEVMPERSVELQTWLSEENFYEPAGDRSLSIWGVAPDIGITDQLELALPIEMWWQRTRPMPGTTQLNNYGAELRYRLVTQDPVEAPEFAPLVRVSLRRVVKDRDVMRPEIGFVGTYEAGSVAIAADIGLASDVSRDHATFEVRPALGISVVATGDLRVGAEAVAYVPFEATGDKMWVSAGPNLSWTHGRFWLSAAYAIGIQHVKDTPRVQWGIAF